MNWFRFYHEALDDPKVQRLEPCLFKFWVNVLCLASRGKDRGFLPPVADIAFALRVPEGEAEDMVEELIKRELLARTDTGFAPHNWQKRQQQSDDVNARVKKHRESKKDETLHETLQETGDGEKRNGLEGEGEGEEIRPEETPAGERAKRAPRPPKPSRAEIVAAWSPHDDHRRIAIDRSIDLPSAERMFRNYASTERKEAYKDLDRAFENWLLRERPGFGQPAGFAPNGRASPAAGSKHQETVGKVAAFAAIGRGER